MNMKKEKKIKINYVTYIKNHYIPSTVNMKKWILKSLLVELPSQINIIFVGKKRIRTLNNKYLNHDYSTNVLTFPYDDSELLSGDIVLCPEIINHESKTYELSKKSALWGSLMVGLTANMRQNIDWADKLMIKLFDMVSAHTIEEFSLSESLIREYNIVEGKKFVSLYSTSRKK